MSAKGMSKLAVTEVRGKSSERIESSRDFILRPGIRNSHPPPIRDAIEQCNLGVLNVAYCIWKVSEPPFHLSELQ